MSKKPNRTPVVQVSPIAYFAEDKEPLPHCLAQHTRGTPVNVADLLDARVVYYPGGRTDGSPVRTFNVAHAAHVYVYADYGLQREELECELSDGAFTGYHLYHEQEVSQKELLPHAPHYHVSVEEQRFAMSGYDMSIPRGEAFAVLKIYERDSELGEEYGAWRFAILYIGADANATYDALFGNTDRVPYACVVCTNMGSGYTCFVRDSLLEQIAVRTNRLPQYLLCMQTYGWNGYRMLRTVSPILVGGSARFVWTQNDGKGTIDDLPEDLRDIVCFEED